MIIHFSLIVSIVVTTFAGPVPSYPDILNPDVRADNSGQDDAELLVAILIANPDVPGQEYPVDDGYWALNIEDFEVFPEQTGHPEYPKQPRDDEVWDPDQPGNQGGPIQPGDDELWNPYQPSNPEGPIPPGDDELWNPYQPGNAGGPIQPGDDELWNPYPPMVLDDPEIQKRADNPDLNEIWQQHPNYPVEAYSDGPEPKPLNIDLPEFPKEYDLDDSRNIFDQYVLDYAKRFANDADREKHYVAFVENLKTINELNANHGAGLFGINEFTDYTDEELLLLLDTLLVD